MDGTKILQYSIFALAQACGLIAFFIMIDLLSLGAGISWDKGRPNVHGFLMLFGMVYLHGLAISAFRALTFVERLVVKMAHAAIQLCVLVLTIVGLIAIFESMSSPIYSIHGVFGIITFCLFALQWLSGFLSFLYPKLDDNKRASLVPYHRAAGAIIFSMAVVTALLGISSAQILRTAYSVSIFGTIDDSIRDKEIAAAVFTLFYGILTVVIVRWKLFKP